MPPAYPASKVNHLEGPIQLRVHEIGQIFHTLDPFPFRERDLDAGVEEYIAGWAGEIGDPRPITIVVHLPQNEAQLPAAGNLEEAIQNYFLYRSQVLGWELRDLFRTGRAALAMGLVVLGACVVLGRFTVGAFGVGYLGRFFEEGLIILGWVANWRPIELFLYDWWPLVRRRRLYRRLARAKVDIVGEAGA